MLITGKISTLSGGAVSHHCAKNISTLEKDFSFNLEMGKFNSYKDNAYDEVKGF